MLGGQQAHLARSRVRGRAHRLSHLQRARAPPSGGDPAELAVARDTVRLAFVADTETVEPADAGQRALVGRYVDAFVRYDMNTLVALLHEDATRCMPPYAMWLRGPAEIRAWMLGPGAGWAGSRLVPVQACASPAFAQWRSDGNGGFEPGRSTWWRSPAAVPCG